MSRHEIGRLSNRRSPGNLETRPDRRHFPLPAGHHQILTKVDSRSFPRYDYISKTSLTDLATHSFRGAACLSCENYSPPSGDAVSGER